MHQNISNWPKNPENLAFKVTGGIHELSSPRVDQSARCPVHKLAIRELAYLRVVQ